jgi:hypothetical protein
MNKAITDGLVLMPPPFAAGLGVWSSTTGRPGSPTYAGAPNAAFVPSDPDFGGCLELLKTESVQRLRWMGETPIIPGCYLRVTARIKVLSGAIPGVRIAGYAADSSGAQITSVPAFAATFTPADYGTVYTVQAIIATAAKTGVAMQWPGVAFGHLGIDLTGPNGGLVRIDDLEIEDVTGFFLRDMVPHVDVRDHGAVGDGVTDDRNAFVAAAAEALATGRSLLVSTGTFRIGATLTIAVPVIAQGTLLMPPEARLQLTRSYDFPTYAALFGSDEEGLRRGLQALFHFTDHVCFDLRGRRVRVSAPIDVAALAGITSLAQRRQLANGQLEAETSPAWATQTVTAQATYSTSNSFQLTGVANIANIPVGARVSGPGVGREVYVRAKNEGAGTLTLSDQLHGGSGTRTYTFTTFRHLLDFSGFTTLERFEIANVEFLLRGECSGVSLPTDGSVFGLVNCTFNRPRDKAVTSIGTGCQGMLIDNCQFLSNEMALPAQERTSIAINAHGNDVKLRNCRVVRFRHFAVLAGSGNIIIGNHFFQGDTAQPGLRTAGIVLTRVNLLTTISGNYIDNCFIELTNEHAAAPNWNNQFSFGGLTMTGNFFLCSNTTAAFRFFVVRPFGSGHFLNGLQVNGNVFRTLSGTIERVEGVDATIAPLDSSRHRNVIWENNAYNGIEVPAESPLVIRHQQTSAATNWIINTGGRLPFRGRARTVPSFTLEGVPQGPGNEVRTGMPYVNILQGPDQDQVRLTWPSETRGRVVMTVRVDNPL